MHADFAFGNMLKSFSRKMFLQINIDEAAKRLGVVRRRMYDIINVFEGIAVVTRKSRGRYMWFGFSELPAAIQKQHSLGPLDRHECSSEVCESPTMEPAYEGESRLSYDDEVRINNMISSCHSVFYVRYLCLPLS